MAFCVNCPVVRGECPQCGTYWFAGGTTKMGIQPALPGPPRTGADTGGNDG
jgi:hypothetical protein